MDAFELYRAVGFMISHSGSRSRSRLRTHRSRCMQSAFRYVVCSSPRVDMARQSVTQTRRGFEERDMMSRIDERLESTCKSVRKLERSHSALLKNIDERADATAGDFAALADGVYSKVMGAINEQLLPEVYRQLQAKIHQVQTTFRDQLTLLHSEMKEEFQSDRSKMPVELENFKQQALAIQEENGRLNMQLSQLHQYQLKQQESDLKASSMTITQKDHEIERLKTELKQSQHTIEQQKCDLQASRNTITQENCENKRLQSEVETLRKQQVEGKQACVDGDQNEASGFFTSLIWPGKGKNKPKDQSENLYKEEIDRRDVELKRYKEEINKRDMELKRMNTEIEEKTTDLAKAHSKLKEQEERIALFVESALEQKQKEEGEVEADQSTHSKIQSEYEELFTTKKRSTEKALKCTQKDACFTEMLGQIFPTVYGECKTTALHKMFQDLYRPHKDGEDTTSARLQARVYGELRIHSSSSPPTYKVLKKAEGHIQGLKDLRLTAKNYSVSQFEDFLKESVDLAWKMVTINPPMIIDQPQKFYDHLHDKAFGHWDEHLVKSDCRYELVYYRSVLYNSYRDNTPASKAKVGNRYAPYH